jgi:hypothetical protein
MIAPPHAPGSGQLDHFNERAMRYTVCIKLAFLLVALPSPYLSNTSVTALVIGILAGPMLGHTSGHPGDGFAAYWHICLLLSAVLAHPVWLWYLLDLTAARDD